MSEPHIFSVRIWKGEVNFGIEKVSAESEEEALDKVKANKAEDEHCPEGCTFEIAKTEDFEPETISTHDFTPGDAVDRALQTHTEPTKCFVERIEGDLVQIHLDIQRILNTPEFEDVLGILGQRLFASPSRDRWAVLLIYRRRYTQEEQQQALAAETPTTTQKLEALAASPMFDSEETKKP